MKRIVYAITILMVIVAVSGAHAFQISLQPTDMDHQIFNPTFYALDLHDVGRITAIHSPAGWRSLEGYMDDFFAMKEGNAAERGDTIPWTTAIRDINIAMGGHFTSGIGRGRNGNGFDFPSEGGSAAFDGGELDPPQSAPVPVPEPAALLLLGIGLTALGSLGRIKQGRHGRKGKVSQSRQRNNPQYGQPYFALNGFTTASRSRVSPSCTAATMRAGMLL